MMTPPSKQVLNPSNYNKSATKMDLQRLLTLPGYSWRKTRHEGDKCGVDGIYLAFDSICLSPAKKLSLQLKRLRTSIRN